MMMSKDYENKKVQFVINSQNLYLKKFLVYFNDIPIFFVCINENDEYFLILSMDNFIDKYLIALIDLNDLQDMYDQKVTMRDTILKGKKFWNVTTGDKPEKDIVQEIKQNEIDLSYLPNVGAFYEEGKRNYD